MINIIRAFKEIWTYPLTKTNKSERVSNIGKNEVGVAEFFKSLEIFSKSKKYNFK